MQEARIFFAVSGHLWETRLQSTALPSYAGHVDIEAVSLEVRLPCPGHYSTGTRAPVIVWRDETREVSVPQNLSSAGGCIPLVLRSHEPLADLAGILAATLLILDVLGATIKG